MSVGVGEEAPGFALPSGKRGSEISPENCPGEGPMVLPGGVSDRSSVRTDRAGRLRAEIGRPEERGARALAVGVVMPSSHEASDEDRGIGFPLLAGSRRDVVGEHGVEHGNVLPERACFVLDREGVVRAKKMETSPEIGEVLEDLRKIL